MTIHYRLSNWLYFAKPSFFLLELRDPEKIGATKNILIVKFFIPHDVRKILLFEILEHSLVSQKKQEFMGIARTSSSVAILSKKFLTLSVFSSSGCQRSLTASSSLLREGVLQRTGLAPQRIPLPTSFPYLSLLEPKISQRPLKIYLKK